jgi:hypothetical protein
MASTALVGFVYAAEPAVAATCPCTIFATTSTPISPAVSDPLSVEVGVKFSTDVNGTVSAIRFYKGATNTGTHVGHLWDASGNLLSTATFSGETASGWQQVSLPAPVQVQSGTPYIASYLAPNGHYADDQYALQTGVDSPPLHAIANGGAGPNGVYAYGSGGFPSNGFNASNYWVDVVFQTVNPLVITTSTLPGGTVGQSYPGTSVAVSGGLAPYTFSLASGSSLPAGLSLSSAGQITGTPTGPGGTFGFTIQATDTEVPPQMAAAQLSITIAREPTKLTVATGHAHPGLLFASGLDAKATLTGGPGQTPLASQTVTFTASDGSTICKAVTDATGVAQCSGTIPGGLLSLLLTDGYYTGSFAGTPSLLPSTGRGSVVLDLL